MFVGHIRVCTHALCVVVASDAIAQYSADATRFALANAGDTLDDPNFERPMADQAVLRLTKEDEWNKVIVGKSEDRTGTAKYQDDGPNG